MRVMPTNLYDLHQGLETAEAQGEVFADGANITPFSKPRNFRSIGFGVFKEPMLILLVASGSIYILMDNLEERLMLLGFVIVIICIDFFQGKKREKAVGTLKDRASHARLGVWDGEGARIAGSEVVKDAKNQCKDQKAIGDINTKAAAVPCADYEGSLTGNKMTLTKVFNGNGFLSVSEEDGSHPQCHVIIHYGALSCQINPCDPMGKTIVKISDLYMKSKRVDVKWQTGNGYTHPKELLAMSNAFLSAESLGHIIASKGAPEVLFEMCPLEGERKLQLLNVDEELAFEGFVTPTEANAKRNNEKFSETQQEFIFEFIGLIGLSEAIRKKIKQTVFEQSQAGIRVIMITGDYPVTAKFIAKEIGLLNPEICITGMELQFMSDAELSKKIACTNVFARVLPGQKLKIVNALKKNNLFLQNKSQY